MLSAIIIVNTVHAAEPTKVTFSQFKNSSGDIFNDNLTLGSAIPTDEKYYVITREAQIYNANDPENSAELLQMDFQSGQYTYKLTEKTDIEKLSFIEPVVYIERNIEDFNIPLQQSSFSSSKISAEHILASASISTEMRENSKVPDDISCVYVTFLAQSADTVPYNMTLISDGVEYSDYSSMYYFDNQTGEFSRGYLVFYGITEDELSSNAYLSVPSVIEKYVPEHIEFEA